MRADEHEEDAAPKPSLRLVPDPEPSPLPAVILEPTPDDPSLGPVVQSQTAVAPMPSRPSPLSSSGLEFGFAGDLPRDARGFAPALNTAEPTLPPFEDAEFEPTPPQRSRGRFVLLMLSVPLAVAAIGAGLWISGALSGSTDEAAGVATAAVVDVEDSSRPITWDEGFRAAPQPDPPKVYAPDTYTPPSIRRPDPPDPMPIVAAPEPERTPAEPVAPKPTARPKSKRPAPKPKRKKRPARPTAAPRSASRPPPPPPKSVTKKKKRPATDPSAPWKRVPVPSDNW